MTHFPTPPAFKPVSSIRKQAPQRARTVSYSLKISNSDFLVQICLPRYSITAGQKYQTRFSFGYKVEKNAMSQAFIFQNANRTLKDVHVWLQLAFHVFVHLFTHNTSLPLQQGAAHQNHLLCLSLVSVWSLIFNLEMQMPPETESQRH